MSEVHMSTNNALRHLHRRDRSPSVEIIDVDTSESLPRTPAASLPQDTAPRAFYVEVPYMATPEKRRYKSIPMHDIEDDPMEGTVPEDLAEIIGENREGTELYYYAHSADGIARKVRL
jgi:hypothetical protein